MKELLFGLGAGRNGTKGGAVLDKVDAGRLPITVMKFDFLDSFLAFTILSFLTRLIILILFQNGLPFSSSFSY